MSGDSERWREQAPCRDEDPEIFHPNPTDQDAQNVALAICARCPVRMQCRDLGDHHGHTGRHGIWCGVPVNPTPHTKSGFVLKVGGTCRRGLHEIHTEADIVHRRNAGDMCKACLTGGSKFVLKVGEKCKSGLHLIKSESDLVSVGSNLTCKACQANRNRHRRLRRRRETAYASN